MGKHDRKRPSASNSQSIHHYFKKPKSSQNHCDSNTDTVVPTESISSSVQNSARTDSTSTSENHYPVSESPSSESASFKSASLVESPIRLPSKDLSSKSASSVDNQVSMSSEPLL